MIFGYLPKTTLEDTVLTRVMSWFFTRWFHILRRKNKHLFNRVFYKYNLNSLLYGDDILTVDYVAKEYVQSILFRFKHNHGWESLILSFMPREVIVRIPLFIRDWATHRTFKKIDIIYK